MSPTFERAPPRRPARTMLVPPGAFADDWSERPTEAIAVGLRLLSAHHVDGARAEASKEAVNAFFDAEREIQDVAGFTDAFNEALLQHLVAAALCDPNDVSAPHPLFRFAADQVPIAFSNEGLRLVWDEVARLHHEASPLVPPITPEGIVEMVALLAGGALERLPRTEQLPTARLLTHCLEVLRGDVADLTLVTEPAPQAP